jgi:hypothetical protein
MELQGHQAIPHQVVLKQVDGLLEAVVLELGTLLMVIQMELELVVVILDPMELLLVLHQILYPFLVKEVIHILVEEEVLMGPVVLQPMEQLTLAEVVAAVVIQVTPAMVVVVAVLLSLDTPEPWLGCRL